MFDQEIWWVTGASSGIGEGLALALAARGAKLILSGRNRDALDAVAAQCSDALVLPFEATDYDAIPALVEQAWGWQGRVDALVNNAGISQRSLAVETDFSVYQHMMAVDLLAPIALTQANLPRMMAAGGGRIVAVSSVAGIVGSPLRSAYSAAKHGLIGYHDSVRCENQHLGINVHVYAPGSIKTNVSRNAVTADGSRRGETDTAIENGKDPIEAAGDLLDAIGRGEREIIHATGVEAHIAALRRSDPEALFDQMSAMMAKGYAQQMGAERKAG
jgi:dehydrogenase/reductase SDR family member 7B